MLSEGKISVAAPEPDAKPETVDKPSIKLRAGTRVFVLTPVPILPPPEDLKLLESELETVYEDSWIVAVNKPPFMVSHPAGRYLYGTVISILTDRYRNDDPEKDIIPHLCHRIDRETSGALVCSKNELVRHVLGKQFEDRQVDKQYLAIVEGELKNDNGIIDRAMDRDYSSAVRVKMACVRTGGVHALTRYEAIDRVPGFTLVLCKPQTGRQHQIRVHLASIGHPIVGDKLYGPSERFFTDYIDGSLSDDAKKKLKLGRQALHANTITLTHPIHKQPVTITAPLANDMKDFLASARAGTLDELAWHAPSVPPFPFPESINPLES